MKIRAREKSTRRLSPSVSVALSRMPSSRFHSASLAFSISSKSTKLSFTLLGVVLVEHFLAQQGMGFAMPQVSGRRADQLGDFVAVLELRAIDLDHRPRVAHQAFRGGLHHARLARPGRPQKQKIADRTSRARHARQVGLVDVDDLLDGLLLAHDALAQIRFQFLGFESGLRRIQLFIQLPHCFPLPLSNPFMSPAYRCHVG